MNLSARRPVVPEMRASDDAAPRVGPIGLDTIVNMLDAVPYGLSLLDPDLRYLLVNSVVAGNTGLPVADHVGRRLHDVVARVPADLDGALRRAVRGQATLNVEVSLELPTAPGLVRYWRTSVVPVTGASGEVVAIVLASVEVTDRVLAELLRADAVRAAQEAATWALRLYDVGVGLGAARTVADVAAVVASECSQAVSARSAGIVLKAEHGRGARFVSMEGHPVAVRRWASFRMDADLPLAEAMRTGRPRFDGDPHSWSEQFPTAAREALAAGVTAQACVPMVISGEVVGALSLSWSGPHEFTEGERRFLVTAAGQLAQAIERIRLFEQQQGAAEMLQRSMLPESLPEVPGLSTAAAYLPATAGLQVGGDWYDVMPLRDGTVLLSLGDVVGSGVPAAVIMGQLRNGLRAIALREQSPARLLDWLEELLDPEAEHFVTLVLVRLDPRSGEVTVANAGHLPPVLLAPDTESALLAVPPSLPLGVVTAVGGGPRTETTLRVARGTSLVLYTDGLVEAKELSVETGLLDLRRAVDAAPDVLGGDYDAQALCEHVMVQVASMRDRSDDIAVLVARLEDLGTCPEGAEVMTLPLTAAETEAARARDWAAGLMSAWGVGELADTVRLVVSEMVTNTLVHAQGGGEVRLRRLVDGVRIEVEDRVPNLPHAGEPLPDATGGRGLLIVETLSDRWGSHAVPGGKIVWSEVTVGGG